MDVLEAIDTRYACRAFLDTPVPEATVRAILAAAARAPSGGNLQPWRVDVLAGARRDALVEALRPRMNELPFAEGAEYEVYPRGLKDPYKARRFDIGERMYAAIGIPRTDRPARYRQFARNFEFFGAPVAVMVSIPRSHGSPQWADTGMFCQTLMLAARGHGLHTCPQEAWTHWYKTLRPFLGLPESHVIFCGIALGHPDPEAPINGWRSPRAAIEEFAVFHGFDEPADVSPG